MLMLSPFFHVQETKPSIGSTPFVEIASFLMLLTLDLEDKRIFSLAIVYYSSYCFQSCYGLSLDLGNSSKPRFPAIGKLNRVKKKVI